MKDVLPHWQKHRRITRQKKARRYLWSPDYLSSRTLFPALQHGIQKFNGLVLDLGCGNQPYQAWFAQHNIQVIGFDPDLVDSQPQVVGLGQRLPFADETFAGVFSAQTLEHVAEPWTMMAEISRVLKPQGYLVLSAPQAWRVHEAPHDYYRYTQYGLRYLAEKYGLIVEQVIPTNTVWAVLGQVFLNLIPHNRLFGLTAPLNLLVNSPLTLMDMVWFEQKETIDNVLIARKPSGDL